MHLVLGLKNFIYKLRMYAGIADCGDYGKLIQLVVDNEASKAEERCLKKHLKKCIKCLGVFELDNELKKVLKLRSQNIEVPIGLAETIKSKINQSA